MSNHNGEFVYVSREDFEAWVDLVGARVFVHPDSTRSTLRVGGTLACGAEWVLNARAILNTVAGRYYGRSGKPEWDEVRIKTWVWDNFNVSGKGARGDEAGDMVKELFLLLVGGRFEYGCYWVAEELDS